MATYKVLSPLQYDGHLYLEGDEVELVDDQQAFSLMDSSVIEPVVFAKPPKGKEDKT